MPFMTEDEWGEWKGVAQSPGPKQVIPSSIFDTSIKEASDTHGVPQEVIRQIFKQETFSGANIKPSSKGAM